jgi:aspartyl-tRNA(Asn)/glutamyl-tRNA(Gln) amidotransferase subunit A
VDVRRAIEALEALDPRLNAFITRTVAAAEAAATRSRPVRGVLAGVPIAIKDLVATAGVRTTAGSRILADHVPTRDAPVVRALQAAGAISLGKTNTHEFAFGTTNDNPHYGATHNPWDPALTTGGSSGGSAAAVAAGIVPLALGTDTAGSVRIPAALCGCVGFKPGWGKISTRGVIPLGPTLDTVGFLGASVALVARGWAAARGGRGARRAAAPDAGRSRSLAGVHIGVVEDHAFDRVAPAVGAAIEAALRRMERSGARIVRLRMPALNDVVRLGVAIVRPEARAFHGQWFPARRAAYGPDVAASLAAADEISGAAYLGALEERKALSKQMRGLFELVDMLAGPTVPIAAFPNADAYEPVLPGGELPRFALTRMTYPYSLSRLPAITLPCGLTPERLPVGLQLAAAGGAEEALLELAARVERCLEFRTTPPVFSS